MVSGISTITHIVSTLSPRNEETWSIDSNKMLVVGYNTISFEKTREKESLSFFENSSHSPNPGELFYVFFKNILIIPNTFFLICQNVFVFFYCVGIDKDFSSECQRRLKMHSCCILLIPNHRTFDGSTLKIEYKSTLVHALRSIPQECCKLVSVQPHKAQQCIIIVL